MSRIVGCHVGKDGSFVKSIQAAIERWPQMTAAQIFVSGPRTFKPIEIEREELRDYIRQSGVQLFVHSSYITTPFSATDSKRAVGVAAVKRDLRTCADIGAKALVVHLPNRAVDIVLEDLPALVADTPDEVLLLLETNTAKSGIGTYETPEKLNRLTQGITDLHLTARVGICIDTAHLWACGLDIRTYAQAKTWIDSLKHPELIRLWHANDSGQKLGLGKDKHERLLYGQIWGKYKLATIQKSGLWAFIEWAERMAVPIILERDEGGIESDMRILR